jgi:acylphosphatase
MDDTGGQICTYDITVHGDVQGVGYRAFVFREANRYGVSGWVRNEADGSVRVLAQHSQTAALEAFVDKLRLGPLMAVINSVDVQPLSTEERFVGMAIR